MSHTLITTISQVITFLTRRLLTPLTRLTSPDFLTAFQVFPLTVFHVFFQLLISVWCHEIDYRCLCICICSFISLCWQCEWQAGGNALSSPLSSCWLVRWGTLEGRGLGRWPSDTCTFVFCWRSQSRLFYILFLRAS